MQRQRHELALKSAMTVTFAAVVDVVRKVAPLLTMVGERVLPKAVAEENCSVPAVTTTGPPMAVFALLSTKVPAPAFVI